MKLKPLKQWICDTCHGTIEKPEDGYIVWKSTDDKKKYDFKIVHQEDCEPYGYYPYSAALTDYLGESGLVRLLGWVDPGEHNCKTLDSVGVNDLREWVTIVRRLQNRYYEEGRSYFSRAKEDGLIDSNEDLPYLPDTLEYFIDKYSDL